MLFTFFLIDVMKNTIILCYNSYNSSFADFTGGPETNMKLNAATPEIKVDPETYQVTADEELLTCTSR